MMMSLSKERRGQCCVCSYFRRLMGEATDAASRRRVPTRVLRKDPTLHLVICLIIWWLFCTLNFERNVHGSPLERCYALKPALRTFILIGRVGEVKHSVLLHGSGRDHRIHQCVVKVQSVDGQRHAAVQAANHHTAAAVVVVLVSHIDDNAAILHFKRLWGVHRRRAVGLETWV